MSTTAHRAGLLQLSPFVVFVGLFFVSTLWFASKLSPLFACTVAIIFAMFTFVERLSLNSKIAIFVRGSAQETVVTMCYIFIFSSVFTYILKQMGGIAAAVNIGMHLIPSSFILPGFFIIVSLFALAIGSSMGTIAAFLPIGVGLAQTLAINPSLMAGVVVSGAMLGDNLSIISDTTIAATQTVGCNMTDKFKANVRWVIPAFALSVLVLSFINVTQVSGAVAPVAAISVHDLIVVLPYLLVFVLALLGLDVIAVLMSGILLAIAIGVWQGHFSFLQGTSYILEGFSKDEGGIHEVLVLSLFIAGLSHIVEYNGGIHYLLDRFSHHITSKRRAEVSIAILIFLVNAAVAINTVAILVTGPVAKRIAKRFKIPLPRAASLLDVFSCICQGILPYAPQLLLAGSLAGVSSVSIIPHLHYQGFILLVMMWSLLFQR